MGLGYTHISRPFAARVVVDKATKKKRVQLEAPLYYEAEVAKFKEGDKLTITLTNRKEKRTEAQNRYWWGVFLPLIIAEGKGAGSPLDTHEDFARKFLTIREWRNSRGQVCYVRRSTTELSVGQFCEFVINVQEETGVAAPPTENYDLAPLKASKKKKK